MKSAKEWRREMAEAVDKMSEDPSVKGVELDALEAEFFRRAQADAAADMRERCLDACAVAPGAVGDPGIEGCMAAIRALPLEES